LEGYIVILEDEERYNLTHDYLASPIRDATADIETPTERATRLLEQYIEQAKTIRGMVMPWKTLRFVRRFADKEGLARSDAALLIRRSRLRFAGLGVAAAVGTIGLATLLLPFGVRYPIRGTLEISGYHATVSKDGTAILLTRAEDHTAKIIRSVDPFQPLAVE